LDDVEILFAEDGSTDGSYKLLLDQKSSHSDLNIRIIHDDKRKGKGGGFQEAFLEAAGEIVILSDADLAVSPGQIGILIDQIDAGYDIAIGSRSHPKTQNASRMSFVRFIYARIGALLARLLFYMPFTDTQCGFKAFRKRKTRNLVESLVSRGWFFDFELIVRALHGNLAIKEIPVRYRYQEKSKMRLIQDPLHMLVELYRLRLCTLKAAPWGRLIYPRKVMED
jgi:glycosyltransferase involved in cell wall biosynthesis